MYFESFFESDKLRVFAKLIKFWIKVILVNYWFVILYLIVRFKKLEFELTNVLNNKYTLCTCWLKFWFSRNAHVWYQLQRMSSTVNYHFAPLILCDQIKQH